MTELQQRIHDLAGHLQLLSLATVADHERPRVRYVVGKADRDLTLRFSTHLDSNKVRQIGLNPNVHVALGGTDTKTQRWCQVDGVAEISTAASDRHAFWFDGLRAYFKGVDDPRYCVVIIKPTRIELVSMSNPQPEVWQPALSAQ